MPPSYLPPYRYAPVPWTTALYLPVPGRHRGRLRIPILNFAGFHQSTLTRCGRRKGYWLLCSLYLSVFLAIYAAYQALFGEVPTLVFRRQDLRRIWQWEVASGHYPTRHPPPRKLDVKLTQNPALPPVGPKRIYLNVESSPPQVAYPPRPLPGSIADLDVLMNYCDVSQNMALCTRLSQVLRVGAGLDIDNRVQRPVPKEWQYVFVEADLVTASSAPLLTNSHVEFEKSPIADWEPSPISLPPITLPSPSPSSCEPDDPRIFHMYWTGEFTDKPYMSILSFLFTQNTGMHLHDYGSEDTCRPQLWMWINPVPASQEPHESAPMEMLQSLRKNVWSAPFLHPRFQRVVQFKFWNTTEQLDSLPELRDDWRNVETLFKSFGKAIATSEDAQPKKGSKDYDRLSVVMSDMVRFVLCQRYGGVYLDADMLFLRDWEELWGWRGSFSYRWSFHTRYNTAVLRLRKGSALGTFLLRTATKNELDFHPITVSRYLKEAHLDGLLYRIPDALFDPAWMNGDGYQRDRPPQPYFKSFADFFDAPSPGGATPQALGFDGFFKGAFTYHFHNSWWKVVDPGQNWPNLGPQFAGSRRPGGSTLPSKTPRDLSWATVLKRTFEAYVRGERPNMYGEWILW
ncbi:hypothetical protein CPB85DRAFT_1373893 [Mucidula mucida]|nr:hypothetical protein CPB85DRAFT_1373893 [Mucidula mucida]